MNPDVLEAIRTTYPGWRITRLGALWWATLHTAPDAAERALGVQHQVAQPSVGELVVALAHQAHLLSLIRRT
ncbi:hypothetical protein [Spongiactinospora sp. TRM90649]|uniref:hypothetical protein n=1 Tax=Spongiactinospora sp. TRM90649 TaxID=3031114 RepID=UPI0023F88600|nr:hypothetical protein [Spongiactinospora sp. TRM90649]MDF5758778.1 hypothetical protein [Spongiactinospora sp. TRM90649]